MRFLFEEQFGMVKKQVGFMTNPENRNTNAEFLRR